MTSSENIESPKTDEKIEQLSDRPLNLRDDQVPDLRPQIRQLDWEWVVDTVQDNAAAIAATVLVGGALGLLMRRKVALATCFAAGVVLQQVLIRRRPELFRLGNARNRDRNEIELERYAMKAQLGDYGKLEVIPFK